MKRYQEFVQMPDDARLRQNYLSSHGLSESKLDALPPADKALHEEKIAELSDQTQISLAVANDAKGDTLSSPVLTLKAILQLGQVTEEEAQQVQGTSGLIG
ncbi:hypothetical protein [Roseibium algae]|uniref:Uncharacterized protein n=1 Tax=Roseibium algae TaxID=3123038 RepID=A0ABU8TIY4_9HYPH